MNYKLCLLLLIASLTSAGPKKHEKKEPPRQIKGRILDQTNKPLSQAILKIYDCDVTKDTCNNAIGGGRSLADGSFVVEAKSLKQGLYTLEATMPPLYLAKAKVPIFIPQDFGKNFDFILQRYTRDAAGNLIGVSADDAKEIYLAAKLEHDTELEVLSAKIIRSNENRMIQGSEEESPQVAHDQRGGGSPAQLPKEGGTGDQEAPGPGTAGTDAKSIVGCLNASDGNFTLTDRSGLTHSLIGDTYILRNHVGQEVQLRVSDSYAMSSGTGSSASGEMSASSNTANSLYVRELSKLISDDCRRSRDKLR